MNNPIALVTGVSRLKGIGRSICTELANRGFDIFFTYWTPYDRSMPWAIASNEPQIILQEIRALGVRCEKLEIDLSKEESTYELLQNVESVLGKPHVLVNNATYSTSTDIDNISSAELDKHYHINLRATTLLSIQFIRNFNYNKNGRIINISSGQSLGPMPDEIAYAITKGAIETLTKTIYQKIAHKGITINAVNPEQRS